MTGLLDYLKNKIKILIFPKLEYLNKAENREKFEHSIFKHNNFLIVILAYFLFLEQLYYGYFVREMGSLYQKVHLVTAFLMLIYAVISSYFCITINKDSNIFRKSFVISFGVLGFFIAVARTVLFQNATFTLPTIYLAVNYGLAVVIYLKPVVSLTIYTTAAVGLIYSLSILQPELIFKTYAADIISNAIIAWIVSAVNYHRYLQSFINKIKISEVNQKLRKISTHDSLTELYNRRKLDELLKQEFNRSKRYQLKFSVIMIDIDNFKEINDTYGHNIGDEVLIELSQLLKSSIRKIDKLGRWGGEEFLIIAPETDLDSASKLAEKLRKNIYEFNFENIESLSASFGVAEYEDDQTIYQLVNRADKALYQAKENGKNRVEISD